MQFLYKVSGISGPKILPPSRGSRRGSLVFVVLWFFWVSIFSWFSGYFSSNSFRGFRGSFDSRYVFPGSRSRGSLVLVWFLWFSWLIFLWFLLFSWFPGSRSSLVLVAVWFLWLSNISVV